ncbi:MAG TPA: class I SAM-dependent methyltransferase [Steroidobacteraceae bacterium]
MSETQEAGQNRIVRALERRLGRRYQQFLFWRSMRRFLRAVDRSEEAADSQLLNALVRGWGNTWSAQLEFLEASLREARATDGPILECGSGLSTLLIGAVAQACGGRVWSLEHEPRWADRVQRALRRYHIRSVTLCRAPVRSYGDFDWYELSSLQTLPGKISLVICDGPPGGTRGGRYGLVPVLLDKLRTDCTILLDDGAREQERAIAARWGQMLATNPELMGKEKPFIRLRAGRTTKSPLSG